MDRERVSALVRDKVAGHRYEPPPPGCTSVIPWYSEKVSSQVEKLREAVVAPYLQRFELRETYEQVGREQASFAEFWVVAESGACLEWYDPATGEFGLGQ